MLNFVLVSQTLDYDRERACLSRSFPWILKPESPFLATWEKIVLATLSVMAILIPYNVTFEQSGKVGVAVLLMTIVLLFDIFIQISTAVRTSEGNLIEQHLLYC